MNVDDLDDDAHIDELDPGQLAGRLLQAAADLEKRARELVHAKHKHDAAGRLAEMVNEYVALCDRHALVRWDEWGRVVKLRQLAKNLREVGEAADADRYAEQAEELATRCFAAREGRTP